MEQQRPEVNINFINQNIGICSIQATKMKRRDKRDYDEYILTYSDVKK